MSYEEIVNLIAFAKKFNPAYDPANALEVVMQWSEQANKHIMDEHVRAKDWLTQGFKEGYDVGVKQASQQTLALKEDIKEYWRKKYS